MHLDKFNRTLIRIKPKKNINCLPIYIKDLSLITSPFLSGSLDNLNTSNTDEKWIGLWETNRGCPFTCSFCHTGSNYYHKLNKFSKDRVEN